MQLELEVMAKPREEQSQELLAAEVHSDADTDEHHEAKQMNGCIYRFAAFLHPSRLTYRYILLVLLCAAKMGIVYSIDLPAALETTIINVMRVTITQYELLYSLYAWPNVVLVVIGGVLIDRLLGLRLGLILFVILSCVGQLLVAMGGYMNLFWLMVAGRFVFGAGTELASTAVDIFAAALFRDRELGFVFGIVYGADRITSSINLNLSGRLHSALQFISDRHVQLGSVLLFGFVLSLLSLVLAFIAAFLDLKRERAIGVKREKHGGFKLKDIRDFSLPFWLISFVGLLYYIPVFPFISIAQVFFKQKYGYRSSMANLVNSMIYFVPAVAYPAFGLIMDWIGYKLFWGVFTISGTLACHMVFALTGPEYFIPIVSTLLIGLFFSMFTTAVWPQVFLLIQEHQFGTAYGITYALYELGQAVAPIIVGLIVDNLGYMYVEVFFIGVLSITLILIVTLYITPRGRQLNLSGQKRRLLAKQREQQKIECNVNIPEDVDVKLVEPISEDSTISK